MTVGARVNVSLVFTTSSRIALGQPLKFVVPADLFGYDGSTLCFFNDTTPLNPCNFTALSSGFQIDVN